MEIIGLNRIGIPCEKEMMMKDEKDKAYLH